MKTIKSWLSIVLIFLFLALLVSPVLASLPSNTDFTTVSTSINELTVQNTINEYFSQRESFLQGASDSIPIAIAPYETDIGAIM